MKKIAVNLICCAALIVSQILPTPVFAGVEDEINAKYAILIDSQTGEVLFEKDAHVRHPPASITKIMTMLLVMEQIDRGGLKPSDPVTITEQASKIEGTRLFLEPGEIRTVEELLYGVAVESGNDAATALGIHIGGTLSGFIDMMNARAKELGMNDTHFVTACGLHDADHYSSAYDIAIMSRELLKHEDILKYTKTWMIDVYVGKNNEVKRTLANTNKLVARRDYVDGLKTGYISQSGHCLSVTGKIGELRLVGVVLNSKDSATRFEDADKLLTYGFSSYKANYPVKANDVIKKVAVFNAKDKTADITVTEDIYKLTKKSESADFEIITEIDEASLSAPLKKGDVVGKVTVKLNGTQIVSADAVCAQDVEKCSFFTYFARVLPSFF